MRKIGSVKLMIRLLSARAAGFQETESPEAAPIPPWEVPGPGPPAPGPHQKFRRDEFNEFLFDYTSKISIKDIKEAQKHNVKKEEEKRIFSPYTVSTKKNYNFVPLIYVLIVIIVFVIGYFVYNALGKNDKNDKPIEAIYIRRAYEFTK